MSFVVVLSVRVKTLPCVCMENTARGGGGGGGGGRVERLIQHEVKLSAVFASRYPPSAVFFIHTSIGGALSLSYIILPGHLAWSDFL